MRKIYVLDENNQLQQIDAGIDHYSELQDAPIMTSYNNIPLVGSTVSEVEGVLKLEVSEGHRWSDEEVLTFCNLAADGRYDILTEQGYEILFVDSTNAQVGRRYRRINVDYDTIWDSESAQWLPISDTTAKQLIYKFLNADEIKESIVVGNPFILKFYYFSNVGTARVTVTMNGTTFTVGTVSSGNEINIDLTKRIIDGPNTISVKFANDATEAYVPELNITGININYLPNFNQYQAFSGQIPFNYSCSGSSVKIIHFDITNSEGQTFSHEVQHGKGYHSASTTLTEDYFTKGENYISTYMYAVDDNGAEIARTITTNYKVPFLTDDEPLLMVYFEDWDNLKQYASISVPYYVWRKEAGALDEITFAINGESVGDGLIYTYGTADAGATVNYLQYNNEHQWIISSLPTSFVGKEDKKLTFSIVGNYNENQTNAFIKENVTIQSSEDVMQTVDGYLFNFAATDLIRATDTWVSTGTAKKEMSLSGFNWNTDGIQIDDEGNQSLHFAAAASAKLSEPINPLFGKYDRAYTLEISFKVSASASEVPIVKYYNPSAVNPDAYGLFIYPNKAVFKYTGGTSEINYMRGERTHLAYTICNKTATDEDPRTGEVKTTNLSYLLVYINGILSQMKLIASNTEFPSDCGTIEFNTGHNEFDLYAFRGYNSALSSAQILRNYISSFGNAAKKEQLYLFNNVYDETEPTGVEGEYEVSFAKVKGKIPCYVVVCDALPETKEYNNCYGIYYEKEGDEQLTEWKDKISLATTYYYKRSEVKDSEGKVIGYTPWVRNKKIKVGGQGTSSLAYPRKNLKFKHNDKFYIKGHTAGQDKTFTFKADYMDSSGANNIGNAQIFV